jgi:hypothetical protein
MSTFSLAIGHSLLEVEPPGSRLDGLELHLVPVVHPRLLARHTEHPFEPDEAPVQHPQLALRAPGQHLGELPLGENVPSRSFSAATTTGPYASKGGFFLEARFWASPTGVEPGGGGSDFGSTASTQKRSPELLTKY